MKDYEKLILIYYLDFQKDEKKDKVMHMYDNLVHHIENLFDETVRFIVVPTFRGGQASHIQWVNRELLTGEEVSVFNNAIKDLDNFLKEFKDEQN